MSNSWARRVNLCPMRPQSANKENNQDDSFMDPKKRLMRLMRFSSTKAAQKTSENPTRKHASFRHYGFVSRGEANGLQNSEPAQREYFDWILETFREFEKTEAKTGALPKSGQFSQQPQNSAGSEQILSSLRKLREALLHQGPSHFSKKVHLFSVRVSSAVGHYQTYIPSIQYLLADAKDLLTDSERIEIASLLVLHVSHRNESNSEALKIFFKYLDPLRDARILKTVLAFSQGDYYTWMTLYNSESDHLIYAVMSMGLPAILKHMIACLEGAYFTYSFQDLKQSLPSSLEWGDFVAKYNVTWELEEGTVHIRRRKVGTKKPPPSSTKETTRHAGGDLSGGPLVKKPAESKTGSAQKAHVSKGDQAGGVMDEITEKLKKAL